MVTGTILYSPIYGKIIVTQKKYSPVSNSVVWYASDVTGTERPLDGTETKTEPTTPEEKNPLAGISMIKGEKGDKGEVGPMGPRGFKGESIVGPRGPKGDKGDSVVGPKGEDGKTPTKTEIKSLIKPLIPAPIKGDRGEKGEKGDPGKDGKDGRDGKDGLNGLSGGGIHKIDDATDVSTRTAANNEILQYQVSSKKWVNGYALTVSTTAPSDPKLHDLWVDIS